SGHYILANTQAPLDCEQLLALEKEAKELIGSLPSDAAGSSRFGELAIVGTTIPAQRVSLAEFNEPGLAIRLKRCAVDIGWVPNRQDCQVFVAGGGTSGAMAAIGAVSKGANTIVADFFQDLGGTKTMCGVMGYYHGYRNQPYFKQQDDEANQLA